MVSVSRIGLSFALFMTAVAFCAFNMACDTETESENNGQTDDEQDDDTADDDQADDDNDATDDDQTDDDDDDDDDDNDDSEGLRIRLLAGGTPGANGHAIAIAPDGSIVAAAIVGRYLTIYRRTGDAIQKEQTTIFACRPSLAIDPSGNLHVCYFSLENDRVGYATNASGAWQTLTLDPAGYLDNACAIAADQNGRAHLAFATFRPGGVRYATNQTGEWKLELVDDQGSADLGLTVAVDQTQDVFLSYYYLEEEKLTLAKKSGGQWSTEPVAAIDYLTNGPAAMAVGPTDQVQFAYLQYNDRTDCWTLSYADNSRKDWTPETVDTWTDADNLRPRFVGLAQDVDGVPHIMYDQRTAQEIRQAVKTGGAWQTETAIQWGRTEMDSMAFAMAADGAAHISYYQYNLALPFRYAGNGDGSWQSEIIDPTGAVDLYQQLAVDAAGTISIVYLDIPTRQLRRLYGDSAHWSTEVLESDIELNGSFSLLSTDNGLYLSYVRRTPGSDWRLIVADNTSGDWQYETVVQSPSSYYCGGGSLAQGPDDRLYLAYCADHLQWAVRDDDGWQFQTVYAYPYAEQASLAVDATGQAYLAYTTFIAVPYPDPFLPTFFDLLHVMPLTERTKERWFMGVIGYDERQMSPTALALDPLQQLRLIHGQFDALKVGRLTDQEWEMQRSEISGIVMDPTAVYDDHGHVHGAYLLDYNYDLYYVTDRSGQLSPTVIDRDGLIGFRPSMALDQNGTVHVAYYGENALWYAAFPAGYDGE